MKIDSQSPVVAELAAEKATTSSLTPDTSQPSDYFSIAWRRLRRDRAAMFGAALVILIVLVTIFAPVLSPHDPTEQFREGLTPDGQPVPGTLFTKSELRFPLGTDANGR